LIKILGFKCKLDRLSKAFELLRANFYSGTGGDIRMQYFQSAVENATGNKYFQTLSSVVPVFLAFSFYPFSL